MCVAVNASQVASGPAQRFRYAQTRAEHIGAVVRTATAGEQELGGPFAGGRWIVVDRLTGLLAQFKSNGPTGFLLPDRCGICRVSAGGDILDPDSDGITATKLAVDCQVEHGEVVGASFNLELRTN